MTNQQYNPKKRFLDRFGNGNIINSNDYPDQNLNEEDFLFRAQYFIDNGYPTHTKDVQELAHILQKKHENSA